MTKLHTTCLASMSGSVLSGIAWADNMSSIVGLIGTIISAVFGLLSLIILIYSKLKKKHENGTLTAQDLINAIKEGKEGATPFIEEIDEAITEYKRKKQNK